MKFILASASPRRKELLEGAGYDFEVVVSGVDESVFSTEGVTSEEHTVVLALSKAKEVSARYPGRLVVGADTVVDCDGEIIGKPDGAAHAEEITRKLFSQRHRVITGVAFVRESDGLEVSRAVVTVVYPNVLSEEQIVDHIENGKWEGKAGAYGIQETGDEFVEKLDGSYTNVIGMPMETVEEILREIG
jgi:septum formation protein